MTRTSSTRGEATGKGEPSPGTAPPALPGRADGTPSPGTSPEAQGPRPAVTHPWLALTAVALAQVMVILDSTVVNIALPSMQAQLGFSDTSRQWVITSYILTFGALLLLGGRLADLWDRRRLFLIGLVGFAAASALGGAANGLALLLLARVLQGVFATFLAPVAMSFVTIMFPSGRSRALAFGVFSAVGMAGSALGMMLGGALTQALSWRWCLYVNIVIALPAILGTLAFVPSTRPRGRRRTDLAGALLSGGAVLLLVHGLGQAESVGWADVSVWGSAALAAVLAAGFLLTESRAADPLLPLHVLVNRTRGGIALAVLLAMVANYGQFLFLTYYFQTVRGWSPIETGLAFLPMTTAMTLGSAVLGPQLVMRARAQHVIAGGLLAAAVAMGVFCLMTPHSSYLLLVVPAHVLLGTGLGAMFNAGANTATLGVVVEETGIASAVYSTAQQIGGAVGTALLNTVAMVATAGWLSSHPGASGDSSQVLEGTVHGYTAGFATGGVVLVLAAVITLTMVRGRDPRQDAAPSRAA